MAVSGSFPGHLWAAFHGRLHTDGAGGPKDFAGWLERQRLAYSVGFTLPANTPDLLERIDEAKAWTPAYDTDTEGIRDGAWVAELTGLLDLPGWPPECG